MNIANNTDQTTKKLRENGIIFDIIVPIPAFLSYFLAKANTTGKYANNGDIGYNNVKYEIGRAHV